MPLAPRLRGLSLPDVVTPALLSCQKKDHTHLMDPLSARQSNDGLR